MTLNVVDFSCYLRRLVKPGRQIQLADEKTLPRDGGPSLALGGTDLLPDNEPSVSVYIDVTLIINTMSRDFLSVKPIFEQFVNK